MPITIKQNIFKYKNPTTGQYQSVDVLAERSTSEQIADIEATGTTVLNSIPADYTTMSTDVSALKTKVGTVTLNTTNKDLSAATNELNGAITPINFANATVISTSGTDLDDYTNGGIWWFTTGGSPLNKPYGTSAFGYLIVLKAGSNQRLQQIWIDIATNNVYMRTNTSSTVSFTSWFRVMNEREFDACVGAFNKIAVIGDSFASGSYYVGSSSYSDYTISWIQILARMYGISAINYSFGGANTSNFVNSSNSNYNTYGLGKLITDFSNNKPGLYIIALGINDTSQVTLGTINDIKDDYTQNPDTFFGNYGKIIARIKAGNSKAKIICSTFYRKKDGSVPASYDSYNEAIIAIATKFSIPYIDIRTDTYFNSTYYLNNMVGNHPTLSQHSGMAMAYDRLIARVMRNNSYFNGYSNTNADVYNSIRNNATLSITLDSGVTNVMRYARNGNAVSIQANFKTIATLANNTEIASDFPKAIANTEFMAMVINNADSNHPQRSAVRLKIGTDGKLYTGYDGTFASGIQISGTITYICQN